MSSGGTAATLREAGLEVTAVEEVTGFPEMLDGRVKTLHPRIHGGLLADKRKPEHMAQLTEHGIEPFDLVVVNLYPFRETVARGPSVGRRDREDRHRRARDGPGGGEELRVRGGRGGSVPLRRGAGRAPCPGRTLSRDAPSARRQPRSPTRRRTTPRSPGGSPSRDRTEALPGFVGLALEKVGDLRYGENPHQRGALYREMTGRAPRPPGRSGVPGSSRGRRCRSTTGSTRTRRIRSWPRSRPSACVIVKHNNPCGVAVAAQPDEAYRRAFECDTVSAFGGIVAFDAPCTVAAAEAMRDVFTEVVIAPGYEAEALAAFGERQNLRVLEAPLPEAGGLDVRPMPGGALVQDRDIVTERREDFEVVSSREPTEDEWRDLLLAWTIAWRVKSNTIVLVRDGATVGIGAGQMSRVDSSWIATRKAGDRAKGAVPRLGRLLPVPRRTRGGRRRGGHRRDPSGGVQGRRRGAPRRPRSEAWRSCSPARRHFRH